MSDMNNVNLVGRLVKDAEISHPGNAVLAKFSIAVNGWNRKESREDPNFFNCIMWGKQVESVGKYLLKGKQVGVIGELKQERYEKDGIKKSYVNIVVYKIQLFGGGVKEKTEEDIPF